MVVTDRSSRLEKEAGSCVGLPESASHCHAGGTPGTRDHDHAEGVVSSRNAKERQ